MATTVIGIEDLEGTDGFTITGSANNESPGSFVSKLGDINGDGIDDFVVGAAGADPGGANNAGEAYVVFCRTGGFGATFSLTDLDGTNGFLV
jgi:hypothetical protein